MLINPIKLNNIKNRNKSAYQSRPILPVQSDSFEYKVNAPTFTGAEKEISLHFPLNETKKLLTNFYKKIRKEQDVYKKADLIFECTKKFKEIVIREELGKKKYNIVFDRSHEIFGPWNELIHTHMNKIYSSKITDIPHNISSKELDNQFKYTINRTMNVIKRYEFLLNNGLHEEKVQPDKIFKMSINSVKEKAKKNNIQIKLIGESILKEYKNGIPHFFGGRVADYQLYTIFSNIIQNAVKYTANKGEVIVKFEKKAIQDENYLVFSVLDHGIGIPPEEQEKVLDGYRATNALKSGIEGTGYGLERIKKILSFLESHLEIDSPINKSNKKFPGTKMSCYIRLGDE